MKNQKGNTILILVIIIIVVALAFWWFMKSGYKVPGTVQNTSPTIQDASGLDAAAKTLDGTDLNQMDSGINQVSSDSSSF